MKTQKQHSDNPDAPTCLKPLLSDAFLYVVLFSGGRTSAFLAKYVKENPIYKNSIFVFMNTGKELEETLIFANKCDKEFGLNLVWLEAKINYPLGVGTTYTITDFKNAKRNSEPFESMLKKYPMPNNAASNCTRELKQRPREAFIRDNYSDCNIKTIIGIRHDERHRMAKNYEKENIIYPLINEIRVDSKFIRNWWSRQNFDLGLKDYQGNCDLCFKKSLKKRLTIIKEKPKIADWWLQMETKYSSDEIPRFDLRTNKSIQQLIDLSKLKFTTAKDLHELSQNEKELFEYETDCFCKSS